MGVSRFRGGDGLAMIHFSALDTLRLQPVTWQSMRRVQLRPLMGDCFAFCRSGACVASAGSYLAPGGRGRHYGTRDAVSGSHRRRGLLRPRQPPTWTLYLPGRWTTRHRGPFSQVFLPTSTSPGGAPRLNRDAGAARCLDHARPPTARNMCRCGGSNSPPRCS